MKEITRVFIIIGMIFGLFLIFPLIVGCIVLSKFENAKDIKELKVISIICLLFCSQVGGILMLQLTNKELNYDNANNNSKNANCEKEIYGGININELNNKITELAKLHDDGMITDEEFKTAKEKLFDEFIKSNSPSEYSGNIKTIDNDATSKIQGFWLGFFLSFISGLIGLTICLTIGDSECKRGSKTGFFINLEIWFFLVIIFIIIVVNHGVMY